MVKTEQTNVYLLAIVAIVAIVGIVVLILNSGIGVTSNDLTGQAYIKLSTKDDAAGLANTGASPSAYYPDCTGSCRDPTTGKPVCCA